MHKDETDSQCVSMTIAVDWIINIIGEPHALILSQEHVTIECFTTKYLHFGISK